MRLKLKHVLIVTLFLLVCVSLVGNYAFAARMQPVSASSDSTTTTTTTTTTKHSHKNKKKNRLPANFADRMPQRIDTSGEKVILVDPRVHAWGAYGADGNLIRAGVATAGGYYCPDVRRACKTKAGTFRIQSLGARGCKSSIYPRPRGGAPMPYCMFFNKNQGLHGSYQVIDGVGSHGCVRMKVEDAEWVRFNFATVGTKVIVRPY